MIVLDTNVVSELNNPHGAESVRASVAALMESEAYITVTVVAELSAGIVRLPEGRRRLRLERELDVILTEDFEGRVLPFDVEAARAYGLVRVRRERMGRPITAMDAQIAAVCLVHGATFVTRNTKDFDGLGLSLVNPWG